MEQPSDSEEEPIAETDEELRKRKNHRFVRRTV